VREFHRVNQDIARQGRNKFFLLVGRKWSRGQDMKKILLVAFTLWIICQSGYCDVPPVQIQLTVDKSEIFTTEFPTYSVKITNTGTSILRVIDTDYKGSNKQWVVDNPRTAIADPVYIGDRWQRNGEHFLKPKESYEDKPRIYFSRKGFKRFMGNRFAGTDNCKNWIQGYARCSSRLE